MRMAEKFSSSPLLFLCLWVNLFQKQLSNRLFSPYLLKIQVVAVQGSHPYWSVCLAGHWLVFLKIPFAQSCTSLVFIPCAAMSMFAFIYPSQLVLMPICLYFIANVWLILHKSFLSIP